MGRCVLYIMLVLLGVKIQAQENVVRPARVLGRIGLPSDTMPTFVIDLYDSSGIDFPAINIGVSINQNYILTRTLRKPVKINELNQVRAIDEENQLVQYFDGLGRPSQVVQLMGSPTYKDIVQHIAYDGFGRESRKYLPYAERTSDNGSFKA